VEENIRSLEGKGALVRNGTAQLTSLVNGDEARQAIAAVDGGATSWLSHSRRYLTLAGGKQFQEAHSVLQDQMLPIVAQVEAASKTLADREREALAVANRDAQATISRNRWIALVLIGLNLVVVALVLLLVRQVTGTFREAVAEMRDESSQVAVAAAEVAASSQALAQGASEQAASLEQTSASSQEIDAMARRNSENSNAAVNLMDQSQEMFRDVNQSLEQMIQAMNEIKSQSDKISRIIRVIDEIAFQTNILALNAAVEAARAGDAGMGFAVVADEVRNLAQRSAQAAKDTAELIEESISKSDAGRTRVSQVANAIRGITGYSDKVKALVDEVNLGSQEQTRGIAQIGSAIGQMDQVTQRNAAGAEQNAATAAELNSRSKALRQVVNRLESLVGPTA
jgi:methyl-accepting chemotaxis protein/methyl-accepting chemotaxis protein-1 (serine sensor receptor)